jgi:hypothetical protein
MGWLSSGHNVTTIFSKLWRGMRVLERVICACPTPQFSTFTNRSPGVPLDSPSLLQPRVWGLAGGLGLPADWTAVPSNSPVRRICSRVIALSRLEMLQHVRYGCISAYQLCGNSFSPLRIEHSGTNADDNKVAIQDLYRAANSKMTGTFACLLAVANRIWFFQIHGPGSRSK